LLALKDQPIYFGHAGWYASSREIIRRYRTQLHLWKELISRVMHSDPADAGKEALEVVLKEDPLLSNFPNLEPSAQERERFFMSNSIAGFVGYLNTPATGSTPSGR
jgi:hypothetical protein